MTDELASSVNKTLGFNRININSSPEFAECTTKTRPTQAQLDGYITRFEDMRGTHSRMFYVHHPLASATSRSLRHRKIYPHLLGNDELHHLSKISGCLVCVARSAATHDECWNLSCCVGVCPDPLVCENSADHSSGDAAPAARAADSR